MNDEYVLSGCIDFGTAACVISVPVFKAPNSNYLFIPKTDHHFLVLDFYVMEEFPYEIRYLPPKEKILVRIGEKCPVPVLDSNNAFMLDPDATADQIRAANPLLPQAALKQFLSLRSRLLETDAATREGNNPFKTDISEPVRSRYWVSMFNALVASVHQSGRPNADAIQTANTLREDWFRKFSNRATFSMVESLLNSKYMPVPYDKQTDILLDRFDKIFQAKCLAISAREVAGYEKLFPKGIIPHLKNSNEGPTYDAWRMQDEYNRLLYVALSQKANIKPPEEGGDVLSIWPKKEVEKIYRIARLLIADEPDLYFGLGPLTEIQEIAAGNLIDLSNLIVNANNNSIYSDRMLVSVLASIMGSDALDNYRRNIHPDKLLKFIRRLLDYYDKAIALTQTINSSLRMLPASQVGIDGVDPTVFEDMREDVRVNFNTISRYTNVLHALIS